MSVDKRSVYKVTYTKKVGEDGEILVKAHNEDEALNFAKFLCFTGTNFRDPTPTDESYAKPRRQGFYGSNRMN